MRTRMCFSVAVILGAIIVTPAGGQTRTWTDHTGDFSVQAELVRITDQGMVVLRRSDNGLVVSVSRTRLSDADQAWIDQHSVALPSPSAPMGIRRSASVRREAVHGEQLEQDRLASYQETGVWRWPELSRDEQSRMLAEQKRFLEQVTTAYKDQKLRLHETRYFLFLTDIPGNITANYIKYLDKMYLTLCQLFDIPRGTNIWAGKAVVVAFLSEERMLDFEKVWLKLEGISGHQGKCIQKHEGQVFITCFFPAHTPSFCGLA